MPNDTLADKIAAQMGMTVPSLEPGDEEPGSEVALRPDPTRSPDISGIPVNPYEELSAKRYGSAEETDPRDRSTFEKAVETGAFLVGPKVFGGPAKRALGGLANKIGPGTKEALPTVARLFGAGMGQMTGRQFTMSPEDNRTLESGLAFAEGVLAEEIGILGGKHILEPIGKRAVSWARGKPFVGRIVEPFSGKLIEGADEALEQLAPYGVGPTPGQISKSRLIDAVEQVVESSEAGAPRLLAKRSAAEARATQNILEFGERFGQTRSKKEVGELAASVLRNEKEAHRAFVRSEARNLDRLGRREITVDIGDVLDEAKAGKKAAERLGNKGTRLRDMYDYILLSRKESVQPGIGAAKGARSRAMERTTRSNRVSFEEAQEIRSILLEAERAVDDPLPNRTAALAGRMAGRVDEKMELAAKLSGRSDFLQAFRDFNSLVKKGYTAFNNPVMKGILGHTEPEVVYSTIIKGNDVPASRIGNVRHIIEKGVSEGRVDPNTWETIQGRWIRDQLDSAADSVVTGKYSGEKLLGNLKTTGQERLDEIFPIDRGKAFKSFARTLYITQKTASDEGRQQFGGVAMRLVQAGAIIGFPSAVIGDLVAGGGLGVTSATAGASFGFVMVGPMGLARILADDTARRLLTKGMTSGPTTTASRVISQKLIQRLDEILPIGSAYVVDPNENQTSDSGGSIPSILDLMSKGAK